MNAPNRQLTFAILTKRTVTLHTQSPYATWSASCIMITLLQNKF